MLSFDELYPGSIPYTLLGADKMRALFLSATIVAGGIRGAVAELGVYKGGTAKILCTIFPDRAVYLFDTFTGTPSQGSDDKHVVGDFGDTSLELAKHVVGHAEARFIVGQFPATLTPEIANERFAFVHLDMDQQEPTQCALDFFWPRMVPGGVLVMDDYRWEFCLGATKAIDLFLSNLSVKPISMTGHQLILVKPSDHHEP